MKIGIIQGRLSKRVDGEMQEFPIDNWKQEFILLKQIGLSHIDWVVTKKSFANNPIFNNDLSLAPINSICADNLIDKNFTDRVFLEENLSPLCEVAIKNKINSITIPLLEESSIVEREVREEFKKNIFVFSEKFRNINFSFEFESTPEQILEIANLADNFKITYDTGNVVSFSKNPDKGLHSLFLSQLLHKIDNVHLKDRNILSQTFIPGQGQTRFKEIFDFLLRKKQYQGVFTIQTAREKDGEEFETIKRHLNFFENYIMNRI